MIPSPETAQHERPIQASLLSLVQMFLGADSGREDDEHPLHPGPWHPVIRRAVERAAVMGPSPEPWRRFVAEFHLQESITGRAGQVSLNPQPLPPRVVFVASVVKAFVDRVGLMQDIEDSASNAADQRGIIIVSGYTSRFVDEFCGNGFRLRWPYPGPHPEWFPHELDGRHLLIMAAQFDQSAKEAFSPSLRKHLSNASARFAEAALARMQ
jgi:hypothetical protein